MATFNLPYSLPRQLDVLKVFTVVATDSLQYLLYYRPANSGDQYSPLPNPERVGPNYLSYVEIPAATPPVEEEG